MLRQCKLNEANLVKRTALQLQRVHAEEEARLRKELDKKHMHEQIHHKQHCAATQARLRTELVGDASDHEQEFERKALERFQQLKLTEMDRRIRAVELQKKTLANQVDG